jgi:hypothetical protein
MFVYIYIYIYMHAHTHTHSIYTVLYSHYTAVSFMWYIGSTLICWYLTFVLFACSTVVICTTYHDVNIRIKMYLS